MKKILLLFIIGYAMVAHAQRYQPTAEELRQAFEFTVGGKYMATTYSNSDWLDTTTTYIEFFQIKTSYRHGVACFKYFVNPTWSEDHHWVLCDCAFIDKRLDSARREYFKHHPKK